MGSAREVITSIQDLYHETGLSEIRIRRIDKDIVRVSAHYPDGSKVVEVDVDQWPLIYDCRRTWDCWHAIVQHLMALWAVRDGDGTDKQ